MKHLLACLVLLAFTALPSTGCGASTPSASTVARTACAAGCAICRAANTVCGCATPGAETFGGEDDATPND